jgi:hypothetical protein
MTTAPEALSSIDSVAAEPPAGLRRFFLQEAERLSGSFTAEQPFVDRSVTGIESLVD